MDMNNKTYKCEKCGRNFTFAWNLKQHLKHNLKCGSLEEEFKCANCGKKFTLGATLNQHFARCIAVDPHRFFCTHCFRKFTFKSSLRKHLRKRCPNINYDSTKNISELDIEFPENAKLEEVPISEIDIKTEDLQTEPANHHDEMEKFENMLNFGEDDAGDTHLKANVNTDLPFIYEEGNSHECETFIQNQNLTMKS